MTDRPYLFHKSVIGYLHIQNGFPCQDSSLSLREEQDRYQLLCVSDGHGSASCPRSDRGSRFAVSAARDVLTALAEAVADGETAFGSSDERRESIADAAGAIVAAWRAAVEKDLEAEPATEKELAGAGRYEGAYRRGERLERLYGATLICALRVGDALVLLQQGDGRCDVFTADGKVFQPIPWDPRCRGTATTSLCDPDAADSIRSRVIDLAETPVVACFLGSDGVEDAYYDNEDDQRGTHRFFMELTCRLLESGPEEFDESLEDRLTELSRTGESGDDVSVAAMVDPAAAPLRPAFEEEIRGYDRWISLRKAHNEAGQKLVSMERKHDILEERKTASEAALAEAREARRRLEEKLAELGQRREAQQEECRQAERKLEAYRRDAEAAIRETREHWEQRSSIQGAVRQFVELLRTGRARREEILAQRRNALGETEREIAEREARFRRQYDEAELERRRDEAAEEYAAYDARYRHYEDEADRLRRELRELRYGD